MKRLCLHLGSIFLVSCASIVSCLTAHDANGADAPRAAISRSVAAARGFGPITSIEASSEDGPAWAAEQVVDQDWLSSWRADDEREGAWLQLNFAGPQRVGAIQFVDRANEKGEVAAIQIGFSDGSTIDYLLPPHP